MPVRTVGSAARTVSRISRFPTRLTTHGPPSSTQVSRRRSSIRFNVKSTTHLPRHRRSNVRQLELVFSLAIPGRSQDPNKIIKCDAPGKKCNEELSKVDEIYVIGKDMMSSTLGSVVDQTNKSYLALAYNTKYDDPKDKNRFFFRSDHFNYAVNGIPITFWFDGVHEDYHQPGDEPQKIDYNKMEKVARTIMLTLLELTDLKERPKVDKQLPPELTQR